MQDKLSSGGQTVQVTWGSTFLNRNSVRIPRSLLQGSSKPEIFAKAAELFYDATDQQNQDIRADRGDEMKRLERIFKYAGWLIGVCFLFAATVPVYAGQYESLSPLLIDLKGWQAEPAEGMDMDMGGTKIIQAARQYTRNAKEADAMVMIGNAMMTQAHAQGMQSGQMETAEAKIKTTTIDGYQVSIHHSKVDNEGAVVVVLPGTGQMGAIFIFHYKGLNENDGLSAAKQFNWKKIEQQTKKLMQ